MALKKIRDHWSFLEEIEAPMYCVDLVLESKNYNQDASEEWFNTAHQFHQCSSRHLKSTLFHPRESTVASGFDLQNPFSPKLQSSVSMSRGKDYMGKKLESHNPHQWQSKEVLGKKSLFSEPGNQEEMRPRSSMRESKGSNIFRVILDREGGSYNPLKAVTTSKSSTTNTVKSFTSTRNSRTRNSASEKNQRLQQISHSLKPAATFRSSVTSKVMCSRSIKNSISSSIHFEKNYPQQGSSHPLKFASISRSSVRLGVNLASVNDSGTNIINSDQNLSYPQEEQDISSRLCDGSTLSGNSGTSNITFESTQCQQQKPLRSASISRSSASLGVNSASSNDIGPNINNSDPNQPNPQEQQDISSGLFDGSTSSVNSGTSNITIESTQPQQQKPLHVSGQVWGNTSELLAIQRSSHRKSCVTRQACRLKLKSDVSQGRGSGSSSRKSSVSSLSNPYGDVSSSKLMETRRNGSTTPESRYTVTNDRQTKSLIIFSDPSMKPVTSIEETKIRGGTNSAKPAGATVTKPKRQLLTTHTKALQPLREKKQQTCLISTENKGNTRPSKLKISAIGKENGMGKAATTASCKGRTNSKARLSCGQKGKEHSLAGSNMQK